MPLPSPPQVSDPFAHPDTWDTIYINGTPWGTASPVGGKVTVRGASRFYKIDQKDAKGQDGSTQTYVGTHPKAFRIIFGLWTSAQWAYWNQLIISAFYYSGVIGKVYPVPIYHPATSLVGITTIITDDIGAPEIDDRTKEATIVVTVREYYPAAPGNASVTPVGPAAPSPGAPGFTPNPKVVQLQVEAAYLAGQVYGGPAGWQGPQ